MVFGNLATGYWLGAAAGAGLHWVELGRTTLSGSADLITVSSLAAKPYLMVLSHVRATGGNVEIRPRLNGDSGSNYAGRRSYNGGSSGSGYTSQTYIDTSEQYDEDAFQVSFIKNVVDQDKLVSFNTCQTQTLGAGTCANSMDGTWKWDGSALINSYLTTNPQAGSYDTGSEIVVLGYDPSDTEGTSAWEELGSGDTDGSSQTLTTGTFTSKKYLYFEAFNVGGGTSADVWCRFNDDAGSNYTRTFYGNGGSKDDATNQSNGISNVVMSGTAGQAYCRGFIINKSDKEKLIISESNRATTGASSVPDKYESYNKWINTSSQINKISMVSQTGNFSSGCYIKVWGFD